MKNNETKETKTLSFRVSAEVFDALQNKGLGMELSAHELASKIVQENHQVPIQAIEVKDPVTHSKQVFLQQPFRRVFHFTLKELRSIVYTLTGGTYLYNVQNFRIGIDELRGLMKKGEDLYEIVVETSNADYK